MASRFWVGGAGTWDSTTMTHWALTTGGAGGASAPVAGDAVTFDGSSGAGTVVADPTISGIAFLTFAATTFAGTLDFATNNPNMTFTSDTLFNGSATRTINMGSGTWTLGGTSANTFSIVQTGLTLTSSSANIVFNGNSTNRAVNFGTSNTFASLTLAANSTKGWISFNATTGVTFGSVTVGSGNAVGFSQGITTTITGALTMTGTSSAPVALMSQAAGTNVATVSVGSASTCDWCAVLRVTKAGAGSITATNALDLGGNTGITITAPSGGGSSGGGVIGS